MIKPVEDVASKNMGVNEVNCVYEILSRTSQRHPQWLVETANRKLVGLKKLESKGFP